MTVTSSVSVAVYTPLNRLEIPSGVPRHIMEIVPRLMRRSELEVSLFVNDAQAQHFLPAQDAIWRGPRCVTFNGSVGMMQRLWGLTNYPSFEQLGGAADWLYLPADGYVPTRRAKLAVTMHDIYRLERDAPTDNRLRHWYEGVRILPVYLRAARSADKILTVSKFSADRIMSILGVSAARIAIVYNGVDDGFFRPDNSLWSSVKSKIGLTGDRFVVVLGGLKSKKNAGGIIGAWQKFESMYGDFELVVTGHHDEAYAAIARASLRRLRLAPRLTDAELAVLLNRSSCLLFPSFYEGFGMPALEAFAAGAVVVASDIPVFRELLGDAAIYVNPTDVLSIVTGLVEATRQGAGNAQRVLAGRKRARQFTWDSSAASVAEVFSC